MVDIVPPISDKERNIGYDKKAKHEDIEIDNTHKSEFKGLVHKLRINTLNHGFTFVSVLYAILITCWAWHFVMPEWLHFTPEENIPKLQYLLFGGIFGGLINHSFNKFLEGK